MDLHNVIEKINAAYVELDHAWRYVYVNSKAAELLGFKNEELIGRNMWETFPQVTGTVLEREVRRASAEKIAVTFTYVSPLLHRWVEMQVIPTETGVCLLSHDISKHKEAEEEVSRLNRDLLRRVDELQTLLNVVPVAIAVADDAECKQIRLNPAGAAMLGINPGDNASKSAPDDGKLRFKLMRDGRELKADELPMQLASSNNVQLRDIEVDVVHDDGHVVNLYEYASPLWDEQGKVRGCLGVFVDITERKRAEQQGQAIYHLSSTVAHAENIEEVFAATLDALERLLYVSRGSILLADDDGVMRFKAWRGLSEGYRKAVEGHSPWHPDGLSKPVPIRDVENADLGNLKPQILAEGIRSLAFIPLIGERRLIGQLMVYFNEPHAFTKAEMSLMHTISYHAAYAIDRKLAESDRVRLLEREKQARAEAERANRLKDEFLAVVSHEIRTPLNAITGWCHLLKSGKLDDAGISRAVETITRNARSQAQLIDDILDVSRIITGKFQLHKTPVLLQQVIQAAADSVRPGAEEKQIHIDVHFPPQAVTALGEASRLQQVVSNVLSNAVKFSANGGLIDISLEQDDASSRIVVSDNGQGISSEFLPYVFERFRQADGSATRHHGGLGLGLAIAKNILELHGGLISVRSDGPGRGTCVTIQLPLITGRFMSATAAKRKEAKVARPPSPLTGLRVLAVDDHEDTLDLLQTLLEAEFTVFRGCSSAAEALNIFDEFQPDVLIADIAMPGEDGCSLLRTLRMRPGRTIRAIAVTACVRQEDRQRIFDAGFDLHLPKPLDPDVLIRALAQISIAQRATSAG